MKKRESTNDASSSHEVILYTDGACFGNPGPGGWAYILCHVRTGRKKEGTGAEPQTTNNRMEMIAVIEGLKALRRRCTVKVITDSQYVIQGLRDWLPGWKANGWKRRRGRTLLPLANDELWRELDRLTGQHDVHLEFVRGHTGHPENERCDTLAVAAYQRYL